MKQKNRFLGSIKGNIISYVALCAVIIILVTATLNSIVMRNALAADGQAVILVVDLALLLLFMILLNAVVSRMLRPMAAMKTFIKEKVIGVKNCKEEYNEVKEISYLIGELDGAAQSVNQNLQLITNASEDVSAETKDVMKSITSLQTTEFNL